MERTKREMETLLKCEISGKLFEKAYSCAKKKQKRIYDQDHREAVMSSGYLDQLTAEYVKSLSLQQFTMDLSRRMHDMEKEHSANCQSAPTNIHIVSVPAL